MNNFYEGQVAKVHCGLKPLDTMPGFPTGWSPA